MANRTNKKVLGYAGKEAPITEEQAKILTHVNVAFGRVCPDLSIDMTDAYSPRHMQQLRSWNPELKILVSLVSSEYGVWSEGMATQAGRAALAESCAKAVTDYGFDGVDFDWEYPCVPSNGIASSPDDKRNFTKMIRAVRQRLDAISPERHFLVTIAAGADVYYCENVEIPEIVKDLDFINVMTYDLKCGFHALSGHHTNLFCTPGDYFHNSAARALQVFEQYGAPKDKLLLGAGFYSRKWVNVPDHNHGLLQLTKEGGGYGPGYGELAAHYVNQQGYVRYWDDAAKAPYLFDGSTFLSYDDPESIRAKCDYILQQDYAGIFYWEHNCDPEGILLGVIDQVFNA